MMMGRAVKHSLKLKRSMQMMTFKSGSNSSDESLCTTLSCNMLVHVTCLIVDATFDSQAMHNHVVGSKLVANRAFRSHLGGVLNFPSSTYTWGFFHGHIIIATT